MGDGKIVKWRNNFVVRKCMKIFSLEESIQENLKKIRGLIHRFA